MPCGPHQYFSQLAIFLVPSLYCLPNGALHPFIHAFISCCNVALQNMETTYPAAALSNALLRTVRCSMPFLALPCSQNVHQADCCVVLSALAVK